MRTYGKLREKIKNKYDLLDNFAEAMGMDSSTLSKKLNSRVGWIDDEIEKACGLLGIPIESVWEYFFYD